MAENSVDIVYSHMSWGFHYPVNTYGEAVYRVLKPGGRLILTLRVNLGNTKHTPGAKTIDYQRKDLRRYGFHCQQDGATPSTRPRTPKYTTVMCTK